MRLPGLIAMICAACAPAGRPAQPDACPRSDEAWSGWQDRQVERLLTPTLHRGGRAYIDTGVVGTESARLLSELSTCPSAPAVKNLRRFARAQARGVRPGHGLGMVPRDRDYIARQRKHIELPPLLRSQPFLRALARPETYRDAWQMIETRNRATAPTERWDLLLYRSRFLETPDKTTYGRFFVRVPGPPELWIQYGIEVPGMPVAGPIHSASVVSIHDGVHPDTGASMPMVRTFVMEGWMPEDAALSANERAALADCLELEYLELLRAWLLE